MIRHKDEQAFEDYSLKLTEAIVKGNVEKFMAGNQYWDAYIENPFTDYCFVEGWSNPYYDEIDINKITGCNVSDSRVEIPSNYERVIRSIPYILKNECMPIGVLREGDNYFIQEGKHRFYAHILLKKSTIPVSIKEKLEVTNEKFKEHKTGNMINYVRNFHNDGGFDTSYPEKILEFYDENKTVFNNIGRVEVKYNEFEKSYLLKLIKKNQDTIEINGLVFGKQLRSNKIIVKILTECGFDIDERFIENHKEFYLEDKYSADNISFEVNPSLEIFYSKILHNVEKKVRYDEGHLYVMKFSKLHARIFRHEEFNVGTLSTHFTYYNSYVIKADEQNIFYLVGSNNYNRENHIYIFYDDEDRESNLTIKYLGKITNTGKGSEIYNIITPKFTTD